MVNSKAKVYFILLIELILTHALAHVAQCAHAHGETSNVIKRDAKVTRATRAQITSFMRSSLIIFADPFIVILTWNMLIRLLLGFSRNLHPK